MVRENAVIRPARRIVVQPDETNQPVALVAEAPTPEEAAFIQAVTSEAHSQVAQTPLGESSATVVSATTASTLETQSRQVEGAFECEPMMASQRVEADSANGEVDHFKLPTKILRGNLRSGRFETHEGHLVIVGDVHTGAELRVKGDVVVWGELRGLVHAGYKGSREAEVRALKLDAVQIRIADIMARRPDRHSQLPTAQEPWHAPEGSYFPEIARVVDGEIQLYTTRRHHS